MPKRTTPFEMKSLHFRQRLWPDLEYSAPYRYDLSPRLACLQCPSAPTVKLITYRKGAHRVKGNKDHQVGNGIPRQGITCRNAEEATKEVGLQYDYDKRVGL